MPSVCVRGTMLEIKTCFLLDILLTNKSCENIKFQKTTLPTQKMPRIVVLHEY